MGYITKRVGKSLPNGDYIEAVFELRDDSGELSPGFSVTGNIWEARGNARGLTRKRQGRDIDAGGCIHDEILAVFPSLAPLVDLHLASPDGVPMYAFENGWYFYSGRAAEHEARRSEYFARVTESDHTRAADYLHVRGNELPTGLDREGFRAFVASLGERYAARAAAGRALLDSLTDGAGVAS